MENNTSGQGGQSEIPADIKGWNWGALILNWIWGIGNNTFRAFWVFCPFVGFFMAIALGIKGNEWAWRHKKWESVEHFKNTQRKWSQAALAFILVMFLFVFIIFFFVFGLVKKSAVFTMSFNQVISSPEVTSRLGSPIDSGFVNSSSIKTSGPKGTASISYSIEGPDGEATVQAEAVKARGDWSITCLEVDYTESFESTALVQCE